MNKFNKYKLIVRFIIVGTVAFFLNYFILELTLNTFTSNKLIAAITAMIVTINVTFILHDKWTYTRNDRYHLPILKRYYSYLSTNTTGSLITISMFSILSNWLPNIFALGIAALTAMTWNFIMNLFVWRHKKTVKSNTDGLFDYK